MGISYVQLLLFSRKSHSFASRRGFCEFELCSLRISYALTTDSKFMALSFPPDNLHSTSVEVPEL